MEPAFACPRCHAGLTRISATELRCPVDELRFSRVDGVWRFLLPECQGHFEQFIREYETIRRAEGRQIDDSAYFQALPFGESSAPRASDWRIRATSYRALLRWVVGPREKAGQDLSILDVGAGNCWLSYRLAQRGQLLTAADLQTNNWDGLGAHIHYPVTFTPVQAEFDKLPFGNAQYDLVIFNSSFHYSENYVTTLHEALRCLMQGGQIVIMDSPIYKDPGSGRQMVQEREQYFEAAYGFTSNALKSENYLTYTRLDELADALCLRWTIHRARYGILWALRPIHSRMRGKREPAQFVLLVASRVGQ